MTRRSETEKFLRAAVKAGLRMQKKDSCSAAASDGVETLRRIKTSLRKRSATRSNP